MSPPGTGNGRAAAFLVLRLACYAAVVGLVLEWVVVAVHSGGAEALLRENGPVEIVQASLALGCAGAFLVLGSRTGAGVPALLGLACAFAAVRELDGFLDAVVAEGSWKFFEVPIVLAALVIAWQARSGLPESLEAFVGSPASLFVFFGSMLVLVHAQVLGQKEMWETLAAAGNERTVKKAVEECSEITGYLMLVFGTIEVWWAAIMAPNPRAHC